MGVLISTQDELSLPQFKHVSSTVHQQIKLAKHVP